MEYINDSALRLINCLENTIDNFKGRSAHKEKAKNLLKRVKRFGSSPANDHLLENLDAHDKEYIEQNLSFMDKEPAISMEAVVIDLNTLEKIYELIEKNIKPNKN